MREHADRHEPDLHEQQCADVLASIHAFLDHEVDEATEESIREHLAACEPCLDQAEIWTAVRALVKRSATPAPAPATLTSRISFRISSMRIERRG